jgi:hypothetical protein
MNLWTSVECFFSPASSLALTKLWFWSWKFSVNISVIFLNDLIHTDIQTYSNTHSEIKIGSKVYVSGLKFSLCTYIKFRPCTCIWSKI